MRRNWLLAIWLLTAPTAIAQTPPPWGFAALMRQMGQVQAASASFTERKTSPLLSTPILAQGTLTYIAPDYIRKTTRSPAPESFTLDHDRIIMTSGPDGETHEFRVGDAPQIDGLVEGIHATLAGEGATLTRLYNVQLSGNAADWRLQLSPKDEKLARLVLSITICGSEEHIKSIDTLSSDGSDSRMSINETVTNAS